MERQTLQVIVARFYGRLPAGDPGGSVIPGGVRLAGERDLGRVSRGRLGPPWA
jgi:hypothetical protein